MEVVEGVEVDGGGDRSAQLFGGLSGNHGGRGRDVVEVTISKKKTIVQLLLFISYIVRSLAMLTMKTGHPICKSWYLNIYNLDLISLSTFRHILLH